MNLKTPFLHTATRIACLIFLSTLAHAGGPLLVGGPDFGVSGQPFAWDNTRPIPYRTDGGPLGSASNSTAVNMAAQMFQAWGAVSSAQLTFSRQGQITGVADGDVSTVAEFNSVSSSCDSGSQSPIIFDSGTLLLSLTGDDSVLGISGPCRLSQDGKIQSAFSIVRDPGRGVQTMQAIMLHEFGHFIGLDHTDIHVPATGTTQSVFDATPTMYWMLLTPMQSTLSLDDTMWVSKLYPSSTLSASHGTIAGEVLFSDGISPAQDVLVVARGTNDVVHTVVASISGYRFTGNPGQPYTADYLPCTPATACSHGTLAYNTSGSEFGSRDPALIGLFELPVPTGQYTVEIREISGGKIGPINPFFGLPGPEEYWDENESANDEDMSKDTAPGIVTVAAGQQVNIKIILNGTDPTFDIFERGDASASQRDTSSDLIRNAKRLHSSTETGER